MQHSTHSEPTTDPAFEPPPEGPREVGLVEGVVHGETTGGLPLISIRGRAPEAMTVAHIQPTPDWPRCSGLRVLVGFEGETPVVIGCKQAPPATRERAPDVRTIRAEGELIIECGRAKISLRADGRIDIRGGYLVSRSTGPQKIKGATVDIN